MNNYGGGHTAFCEEVLEMLYFPC